MWEVDFMAQFGAVSIQALGVQAQVFGGNSVGSHCGSRAVDDVNPASPGVYFTPTIPSKLP